MLNKLNIKTSNIKKEQEYLKLSERVKYTEAQNLLKANNINNTITHGSENTFIVSIKGKNRILPYKELFFNTKKVIKYIKRHST